MREIDAERWWRLMGAIALFTLPTVGVLLILYLRDRRQRREIRNQGFEVIEKDKPKRD